MNRLKNIIGTGVLMILALPVLCQEWIVPDEEATLANPSEYTLDNVKMGKAIYIKNCKSCHGDPGKNNPLALVPSPVDIASEKMQINSEGALFYKITTGLGLMPPFASTLSVNDRWQLVNFIQNYSPDREQVLLELPPIKAKLLASVNEAQGTVDIMAEFVDANAVYVPLLNAPVSISSKKAFGSMKIGETVTNDQGRAIYTIPENTMGDEQGYLSIVVSLSDEYEAAEVILEKARVGSNKEVPGLIRKGVLWSTNNNVS
ncbi:MAG: cytochrome c, partial [Bacteroidales bacterium]|nr:cytochrome c [Bacteroidales bacterium]